MKNSLIALSILLSVNILVAQNRSINFDHGTFAELKQKALKENKLIFVDAFTTWCGPCKQMAKTVFTNDTVADYYNNHFVNAKIDMEKGEGIELAKQYQVNCYPNLLFIDGKGNIVHRVGGSMSASSFVKFAETTTMSNETYSYYYNNYEQNKSNPDFLMKYIEMQAGTCIEPTAAVNHYFSLQKTDELTSAKNWDMIKQYSNSMDTKEYAYLATNKTKFDALYTTEEVNAKLDDIHYSSLVNIIKTKPFNETTYNQTKTTILKSNLANAPKVIFESDLRLAQKNKDWKSYAVVATNNVDKYYSKSAEELNSISWTFFENVTDKTALLKAESWAKLSTELEPNFANYDTYANLLFKNGNNKIALQVANKSIELAKQDNLSVSDYQSTLDLIEQIKKAKK